MSIAFETPRDPLFVPSMKCQSLLGKALQEHFTKPEQVASVFSSSPSLQNSSAGANFIANFKLDKDSVKVGDDSVSFKAVEGKTLNLVTVIASMEKAGFSASKITMAKAAASTGKVSKSVKKVARR